MTMFSDWYRQSSYFKEVNAVGSSVRNFVAFKNHAFIISVKAIEIIRYRDGVIKLYIEASPLCQDEIYDIIKKYCSEFNIEKMSRKTTIISFKPTDNWKILLDNLTVMFNYINSKHNRIEFVGDLLKELTNVLSWSVTPMSGNNATPSHIIEEFEDPLLAAHVNPLKQKLTAILDLFRGSAESIAKNLLNIRKKMRYLLSFDGEDPNQTDEWGSTPLKYAILFLTPEDVAFLLWRKADPRFRPKGGIYSTSDNAIELTITTDKPKHLEMIRYAYSKPKRDLSTSLPRLQVKSCKVTEVGTQIHSDLVFTNGRSVKTRFMTTAEFHKQESEAVQTAIFKLFTIYFSDPSGDELTPIMKRKANIFMPAFANYSQTQTAALPPLKPEDFGDERLAFWLGVQTVAKL